MTHPDILDATRAPCAICAMRLPETPKVCEPCRARLARQLAALPDLIAAYTEHLDAHNPTTTTTSTANDPVSRALPAGPVPPINYQPRTTGGNVEAPIPINIDIIDPASRAPLWLLHGWVATWWTPETGPAPLASVAQITWLANHLDQACDQGTTITAFADDLTELLTQLRRIVHSTWILIGHCPVEDCGAELHAEPRAKTTACPHCGTTWPRRHWLWLTDTLRPVAA